MSTYLPKVFQYLLLIFSSLLVHGFSLGPASAQNQVDIEFKNGDQIVRTLSLSELHALAPAVPLKVFEVHEKMERTYRAFPARPVLDKVFGKDWEKAQEIVFTSID